MADSVRPHRRQPTRLLHPWDSPGKNTGVGCHFLLQCMKVKSESEVASVVSNSVRPCRRQPTRLLCPWDFPGKSTGVGCHCLLLENIRPREINQTQKGKYCRIPLIGGAYMLSPLKQKRQRGRYYKSPVRDGIEQEGCLGAVSAIEEHPFLQPGLGRKGTERINTLTSLSSHPLISHQCLPLAKPNQKPEGKGAHYRLWKG